MNTNAITTDAQFQAAKAALEQIIAQGTALGDMELLPQERKEQFTRLGEQIHAWETAHYPLPNHSYPILIAEIRRKIDQQGMTQKQAAEALGIPPSRLSELLRMRRGLTLPVAKKLNRVLGIPADFIFNCL